jgi:hypothetical protein
LGPGAKYLAAVNGDSLTVWDTATGSAKDFEKGTCLGVAFTPEGSLVVASRAKPLQLRDPATGTFRPVP